MNEHADIETVTIPDVLSFFELGHAREIAPAGFGMSNHNYLVDTDRGDYVVKLLVNQAPDTIENDMAIHRHLRAAGIATPEYVPNGDGQYVFHKGRVNAVVSRRIKGDTPRHMSADLAWDIGRHLALFHTVVRVLPRPNDIGLMNPAVAVVEPDTTRALFGKPLPRGVIHGDLHRGNVLVDPRNPNRVIAILDFEEAGENLYLIDLAVTLISVGALPDSDSIEPELMDAATCGYETVRTLTDEERFWQLTALRYASEASINWFRANGYEWYARQHEGRRASFEAAFGEHYPL